MFFLKINERIPQFYKISYNCLLFLVYFSLLSLENGGQTYFSCFFNLIFWKSDIHHAVIQMQSFKWRVPENHTIVYSIIGLFTRNTLTKEIFPRQISKISRFFDKCAKKICEKLILEDE